MPSRLALIIALTGLAAGPCAAQTVVSRHAPLSPDAAVDVLRSGHSLSDMANRPLIDPDGPRVYVLRHYPAVDGPPPMAPPEPLARDAMPVPYGGYFDVGYPYVPFGSVGVPPYRAHQHGRAIAAPPPLPAKPAPPPRNLVMGSSAPAGVAVRRR